MVVVLTAQIIQVILPLVGLHEILFPALVATAPADTFKELKSVALYVRVNCKLAGWPPVVVFPRVRFRGMVEPG